MRKQKAIKKYKPTFIQIIPVVSSLFLFIFGILINEIIIALVGSTSLLMSLIKISESRILYYLNEVNKNGKNN